MNAVTVYGLASSEDGKLRYVGQTTQSLEQRLTHHLFDARKLSKIHKSNWINKVVRDGHTIKIFPIEEDAIWAESEIKWITHYKDSGVDLVNTTDGGEGVIGYVRDAAWRKRRSEQMKGRVSPRKGVKLSDETKAKISAAQVGREPTSEETRAKISKALKGKKKSKEHILKLSEARRGVKLKPLTEEHKDKLRKANLGRKHTQKSKDKMSKAQKGRLPSAETRALWSKQRKGKLHTEEQKRKISDGLKNAYKNGRKNALSKLSDDDVREIRIQLNDGETGRALAAKFKVSQSVISEIKNGKSYQNVK